MTITFKSDQNVIVYPPPKIITKSKKTQNIIFAQCVVLILVNKITAMIDNQ